jgi:hypothetical protein
MFWMLMIVVLVLAIFFFGASAGNAFLEMISLVIFAGMIALILASGDFLIIALAVLLLAKKLFARRPTEHEYDVDSSAWGLK